MHSTRPAPRSLARFNVVLATAHPVQAVVLHSVPDADQATIAFHQERERLIQERAVGELVVVQHADATRTLLRERLGTAAPPLGPVRQHRTRVVTVPTPSHGANR